MKIIDIPQSMLELLNLRIDGDELWDAPEAIEFSLEPVPPFAADLLPEQLRGFVLGAARRMQCPPDYVAVSILVMLGSIIGAGCSVRPKQNDDWTEVPNLWGGVVGRPGGMKSPAITAGMTPMAWLENDAAQEHSSEMAAFMRDKVDRETELKILKSDKGHIRLGFTDEEARHRIIELTLANSMPEPKQRRFRTNDATIEIIGELVRDNPRGLLVIRDELIGLLAACDKQGHEGDRSFFLEAWNGRHKFAVDRIGRGSIVIPTLCLSIFGGIQPAKLQDYIAATVAGYDNDGLLQRFQLMVYPDEVDNWLYVDEKPDAAAAEKLVEITRTLATSDFVSIGAIVDDAHSIPYFRFDKPAQKIFIKWLTNLEAVVRKIENPVLAEHFSKYRKLIPALALIFHLVDLADGKQVRSKGISKEALQRAIAWGEYLEAHALRIYSLALDPVKLAVRALATKIKTGKLANGFSERDVYKAEWSHLKDSQVVHAACVELEMDGWIKRIQVDRGVGRPQSLSYNINPALVPQ